MTYSMPQYWRLVISQSLSALAKFFDMFALIALLVFADKQGIWTIALVSLALFLPYLLLGPLFSIFIHRINLAVGILMSGIIVSALSLTLVFQIDASQILLIVFMRACFKTWYSLSEINVIKCGFSSPFYGKITTWRESLRQMMMLIGPALASLLLIVLPIRKLFIISSVLFFLATLFLWSVSLSIDKTLLRKKEVAKKIWYQFLDINPEILFALIILSIGVFSLFISEDFLAVLVRHVGLDHHSFARLLMAFAAGGLLSALLWNRLRVWHANNRLFIMTFCIIVMGFALSLIGLTVYFSEGLKFYIFLFGWFFIGFTTVSLNVIFQVMILDHQKPEQVSWLSSLNYAVSSLAIIVAPVFGALLIHHYAAQTPFLVSGVFALLTGIAGVIILKWYKYKRG